MAELERNPMSHRTDDEPHRPAPRAHPSFSEGTFTQVIEQQTARIPSSIFLLASLCSMAASALLQVTGREAKSRFVGTLAPTLLIMGVYNKLVKSLGTS